MPEHVVQVLPFARYPYGWHALMSCGHWVHWDTKPPFGHVNCPICQAQARQRCAS